MPVECFHTLKGYHLGIKEIHAQWYSDGRWWRRLKKWRRESEWFSEEYEGHVADTSDLLGAWFTYLPGVKDWDDYGDLSVTFNMDEVEEVHWTEERLIAVLQTMANKVNRCQKIEATGEPWSDDYHDSYGHPRVRTRHPALVPLEGMLHKDYPAEMDPTG